MENDINTTSPMQPVQPEKSSVIRRNFTPKFIGVIIGILILEGGAYGYATYLAKKNFDEVSRLAAEGKKQEEELKQKRLDSDFTGWQTYRNEKYGFEVKYPNNLVAYESSEGVSLSRLHSNPLNENADQVLLVAPLGIQGKTPFDSLCDTKSDIIFANKKATQCLNAAEFYEEKSIRIIDAVHFWKSGNIIYYNIAKFEGADIDNHIPQVNQILSTFKFTPWAGSGQVSISTSTDKITIPPLIQGLVWKEETDNLLKGDYMVSYNNFKYQEDPKNRKQEIVKLYGQLWIANVYDQGEHFKNFEDLLKKSGWNFSVDLDDIKLSFDGPQADGPNGSLWGYIKVENNKLRLIGLSSNLIEYTDVGNGGPVQVECPCTYELQVFESGEVDISQFSL